VTFSFVTSVCLSVCLSSWSDSPPTQQIFTKVYIEDFLKIHQEIQVSLNLTRVMGTLHEELCMSMIILRSVLLRIRNVSDKICREDQNTCFMFTFFLTDNRAIYEIMCKNMLQPDRPQVPI
jgi:hypothetical protein